MSNNYFETISEPQPARPLQTQNTTDAQPVAPQQIPDEPAPQVPQAPDTSTGQMVVSVFTADQLYPVVGATVTVTQDNGSGEVLASSDTDRSGRTTVFTLPAPSSSVSQEPTVAIPFSQYRVTIDHPDFLEAVIENVQVFGGVLTQLPVNLVPMPEIPKGNPVRIVVIPKQNL
ncbi:MAG: hypothetical protein J6R66_05205 [Clostridia bacterium]|nr:hypothetical protein [Clostridia bacterium]